MSQSPSQMRIFLLATGMLLFLLPHLAEARYTGYNSGCRGASCAVLGITLIALILAGTAAVTYQSVRKDGFLRGLKQSKPLNILLGFIIVLTIIFGAAFTFNI